MSETLKSSRHGYAYSVPSLYDYLLNYIGRNFTRFPSRLLVAYINFHQSTNKELKLTSNQPWNMASSSHFGTESQLDATLLFIALLQWAKRMRVSYVTFRPPDFDRLGPKRWRCISVVPWFLWRLTKESNTTTTTTTIQLYRYKVSFGISVLE